VIFWHNDFCSKDGTLFVQLIRAANMFIDQRRFANSGKGNIIEFSLNRLMALRAFACDFKGEGGSFTFPVHSSSSVKSVIQLCNFKAEFYDSLSSTISKLPDVNMMYFPNKSNEQGIDLFYAHYNKKYDCTRSGSISHNIIFFQCSITQNMSKKVNAFFLSFPPKLALMLKGNV
jgi:hypothetical protein